MGVMKTIHDHLERLRARNKAERVIKESYKQDKYIRDMMPGIDILTEKLEHSLDPETAARIRDEVARETLIRRTANSFADSVCRAAEEGISSAISVSNLDLFATVKDIPGGVLIQLSNPSREIGVLELENDPWAGKEPIVKFVTEYMMGKNPCRINEGHSDSPMMER